MYASSRIHSEFVSDQRNLLQEAVAEYLGLLDSLEQVGTAVNENEKKERLNAHKRSIDLAVAQLVNLYGEFEEPGKELENAVAKANVDLFSGATLTPEKIRNFENSILSRYRESLEILRLLSMQAILNDHNAAIGFLEGGSSNIIDKMVSKNRASKDSESELGALEE